MEMKPFQYECRVPFALFSTSRDRFVCARRKPGGVLAPAQHDLGDDMPNEVLETLSSYSSEWLIVE